MYRIMLVEDDAALAKLIIDYLGSHGFVVDHAPRGDVAVSEILAAPPDLVILDLMLPGLDGVEVCRRVRAVSEVPILMVTALADDVDQILGLQAGADDYIAKPVRPRLLLARVRALLRRSVGGTGNRTIRLGRLVVDSRQRSASFDDEPLLLTPSEFDLLQFLATRPGQVVSRDMLSVALHGRSWDGVDRSIDLRVSRLRRKLRDDAKPARWLKSVRGAGYLLVPEL